MSKESVVQQFSTTKEMTDWLASDQVNDLKTKYPPPRYSARMDLIERKIIVTDSEAI